MSEINEKNTKSTGIISASSGIGALSFLCAGHPLPAVISALWAYKPIREGISRLVTGSFDISETWLRNHQLMIEAQGASQRQIVQEFANEASRAVSRTPAIKTRAESYAETIVEKKQATRENIARKTLEHLSDRDVPEEASTPSEDFMRSFEGVAEKASSEELQDMMARILAGEIRKPGSISRLALSIADVLDKNIIESMLFIKPYLISNNWVCTDSLSYDQFRIHANLLSSVRITTEIGPRNFGFLEVGYAVHVYENGVILINLKDKQSAFKFTPQADGFNLSIPGQELMSLIPGQNTVSIEDIAKNYRKNEFIGDILVGTIETIDGQSKFVPKSL